MALVTCVPAERGSWGVLKVDCDLTLEDKG